MPLQPPRPREEGYAFIRKLGKGSFGTVYLVQDKIRKSTCCMKRMSLSAMGATERERALQEARLLSEVHHPNIVAYVDSYVLRQKLYLYMEYCDGGDLDQRLKKFRELGSPVGEGLVIDWASQMALALQYLHARKILHRDLKASNVFLTSSGVVKLGDFGVSRVLSQTMELAKTFVGTPYYLSPELLSSRPYDAASDVWALGCICYEMCSYRKPFEATDFPGLALKILHNDVEPISSLTYSAELWQLIQGLLSKDPAQRTKLQDMLDSNLVRSQIDAVMRGSVVDMGPDDQRARDPESSGTATSSSSSKGGALLVTLGAEVPLPAPPESHPQDAVSSREQVVHLTETTIVDDDSDDSSLGLGAGAPAADTSNEVTIVPIRKAPSPDPGPLVYESDFEQDEPSEEGDVEAGDAHAGRTVAVATGQAEEAAAAHHHLARISLGGRHAAAEAWV